MTDKTPPTDTPTKPENVVQTMRDFMLEHAVTISVLDGDGIHVPKMLAVPHGHRIEDLSAAITARAEHFKPFQRTGTAHLQDMQSLIDWTNRNKGAQSVIFADANPDAPKLQAVIDYHGPGAPPLERGRDDFASHCRHRGVYKFPTSKEWRNWMRVSGKGLSKDEMGEFLEAHAENVMDPTPAIMTGNLDKAQPFEKRLIETAARIEGKYGQLRDLLTLSRHFKVYETSNLEVTSNRDTGEQSVQFLSEHNDKDGKPIRIPNLFIIAIPIFDQGTLYRMPVRFRYRKESSKITFILTPYNAQASFDDALRIEAERARDATELPLFFGTPET